MLVFGGWDTIEGFGDGAAFDPGTLSWRELAPCRYGTMAYHAQVWTGSEMLVWGSPSDADDRVTAGALGYDPVADRWRQLPPTPLAHVRDAGVIWTGKEMVVWGGEGPRLPGRSWGQPSSAGAAYDPTTDTWRPLPPSMLEPRSAHATAWTGTEVLIWGGSASDERRAFSNGAAYRPDADEWAALPPGPLTRRAYPSSAWTGTELLIMGGTSYVAAKPDTPAASYRPDTSSWQQLPDMPAGGFMGQALWTGSLLLYLNADSRDSTLMTYEPATATWTVIPGRYLQEGTGVWTGSELVVYGQAEHGEEGTRIWRP